jgi:hypothetical protein
MTGGHLWDSETSAFRPITPEDCVSKTVKMLHTVVRDASREEVAAARATVASLFDEDDKTDYVLMALAGSLFGMSYEELYLLHGYGANGKTTLVSLVKAAFGDYFVTLKAETLANSSSTGESATPFLMSIKGARFVNTAEPKMGAKISTSALHLLAGNEEIAARRNHSVEDPVAIVPTHKTWLSANDVPGLDGSGGHADIRRLRIVIFPFTFKDTPDPKKPNERQANAQLQHKSRGEQIPRAILALAPAFLKLLFGIELPDTANLAAPASVTKDSETHVLEGGILGELKAHLAPNEDGGFSSIHPWKLVADPLMCSNGGHYWAPPRISTSLDLAPHEFDLDLALNDAVNAVHVHDLEVGDDLCVRDRRLVHLASRERNDTERVAEDATLITIDSDDVKIAVAALVLPKEQKNSTKNTPETRPRT